MTLLSDAFSNVKQTFGLKHAACVLWCCAQSVMLSHPAQRPPQEFAQPPVDLAAAELQPLPSDEANVMSGVPFVSPAAAAGAWARPLSAAAAAAGGSSTPSKDTAAVPSWLQQGATAEGPGASSSSWEQSPAGAYGEPAQGSTSSAWEQPRVGDAHPSSSAPDVVTGIPLSCVQGVPDAVDPTVGMGMEQGVALGLDARQNSSTFTAVAPTTDTELADLAESLRVSAVEVPEVTHPKGS